MAYPPPPTHIVPTHAASMRLLLDGYHDMRSALEELLHEAQRAGNSPDTEFYLDALGALTTTTRIICNHG
mgnify:CR=1 FL=1